jgi:hypothetical protein
LPKADKKPAGRRRSGFPTETAMQRRSILAVALLFVPYADVLAQGQTPVPQPGARVRITFPCGPASDPAVRAAPTECRSEGRLVLVSGDTIALAAAGSTTSYSLDSLRRLEVSQGHRSHALAGAGVGFLAGAGAALAVLYSGGSTSLCDRSANQDAIGSGECLGLTALGGLAGAGLGAVIGGRLRTER